MESFSEGDHDKGANDPDVQALIGKARNQICQYATPEWVQHSPILFAGFEEAFKLLAQAQGQHAHPSPSSSAPLSASSTLVSKEPSVGVSKGSAQRDLRSTIQQVPPTIPAAVAAIKNSPLQANSTDASPLQTQHSAPSPSPSSALPPRAALISPSPRSILRTGSAAAPSQLPSRPARSASAALDVKSSVTITDAEIMPPPTQGAVAVCLIYFTNRILTSQSSEVWPYYTRFREASPGTCPANEICRRKGSDACGTHEAGARARV
jgi:hypothetical protein